MKRHELLIYLVVLLALFLLAGYLIQAYAELRDENDALRRELGQAHDTIFLLQAENHLVWDILDQQSIEQELVEAMQRWLEEWEVVEKETTGYAPLCPDAQEGMCFEGDRTITASGAPVVVGQTVAAGPDIEFGSRVWIEGHGFRTVQDRGGAVGNGQLDIAMNSVAEAMRYGRQNRLVVVQR